MKNQIIVLEGSDGVGKTTMLKDLKKDIQAKDKKLKVLTVSLPYYSTALFKKIKETLEGKSYYPPDLVQSMFLINMIDCNNQIVNPFLDESSENHIVIFDRSIISTLIYNAASGGSLYDSIKSFLIKTNSINSPQSFNLDIINKLYCQLAYPISLTVFIQPPAKIVIEHAKNRKSKEKNDDANEALSIYNYYESFYKFLSGQLYREIVNYFENSQNLLISNQDKSKLLLLKNWNDKKSEEENYKKYREAIIAKIFE